MLAQRVGFIPSQILVNLFHQGFQTNVEDLWLMEVVFYPFHGSLEEFHAIYQHFHRPFKNRTTRKDNGPSASMTFNRIIVVTSPIELVS